MVTVGIVATLLLRPFYPELKGGDPALRLLRGVRGLPHDLIGPRQKHAKTPVAYDPFLEMLGDPP